MKHLLYYVKRQLRLLKYTYAAVKTKKDPWNVNIPSAPLFKKKLATVHTHPMGSGSGITQFSSADIKTADNLKLIDYVYVELHPKCWTKKFNIWRCKLNE